MQKHKSKVERDIGTSLCKYQNHQDYCPIIHDTLKIDLQQLHIDFKIFPIKIYVPT